VSFALLSISQESLLVVSGVSVGVASPALAPDAVSLDLVNISANWRKFLNLPPDALII